MAGAEPTGKDVPTEKHAPSGGPAGTSLAELAGWVAEIAALAKPSWLDPKTRGPK